MFLGRRKPCIGSRHSPCRWRETLNKCVVQPPDGRASREKPSQNTLPEDDDAKISLAEKRKKSALRRRLSLDNRGPHKCSAWNALAVPPLLLPCAYSTSMR